MLADRLALEAGGEDYFDFGEAVEPIGELAAREIVFEAAVEFVPDGAGKTGDFSCSGHGVYGGCSPQAGEFGTGMSNGFVEGGT